MSALTRFWAKRPHVSLASRIGGVAFLVLAVAVQVAIGYFVVKDTANGFQSQSEVVTEASDETGLPIELVELYARSVLAEDGSVVFAPIGEEVKVVFPPADNAITWGGGSPTLVLQLDGDEYAIHGEIENGLVMEAPVDEEAPEVSEESSPQQEKPVDAVLTIRPVDWGDSLPPAYDNDPYMTLTITDASDAALHTHLPAQASFDLVFAKKNPDNSATFTNVTRDAYANTKEFDLVVATSAEGESLAAWHERISQSGRSTLDKVGLMVFSELLALGFLAFAFGVYRGGFE